MNLNLTRAEVAAVIDYVYQHVRATEGKGKQVWEKMHEFLTGPQQGEFKFDKKQKNLVNDSEICENVR